MIFKKFKVSDVKIELVKIFLVWTFFLLNVPVQYHSSHCRCCQKVNFLNGFETNVKNDSGVAHEVSPRDGLSGQLNVKFIKSSRCHCRGNIDCRVKTIPVQGRSGYYLSSNRGLTEELSKKTSLVTHQVARYEVPSGEMKFLFSALNEWLKKAHPSRNLNNLSVINLTSRILS